MGDTICVNAFLERKDAELLYVITVPFVDVIATNTQANSKVIRLEYQKVETAI